MNAQPATKGVTSFWERPAFLLIVALLTAVPLLFPETPPLVDLPGHLGRYRIEIDIGSSKNLQQYFDFQWRLIGNLGVDLLVLPLAPLVGLELAVKLIVLAIPPLTAAGIFWMSREVHGRVQQTALFALPFAYSFAFNWGFINFALSLALAFLAFAGWLRLSRHRRPGLQAALFVPISCLVWLCHAFGWGVLGVLVWGAEFVAARKQRRSFLKSCIAATIRCVPLAAPLLLMAVWRTGSEGVTSGFFQFDLKLFAIAASLRDRWLAWDALGVAVAIVLIAASTFDRRVRVAPALAVPTLLFAILFLAMPTKLFGSAYADARLAPVMIIVGLTALRMDEPPRGAARAVAWLGCLFAALRLAGNTLSFATADREMRQHLTLLAPVPAGARILFLAEQDCDLAWALPRNSHLGSFAIVRRNGFSNDQWSLAGSQLLSITYETAGDFRSDPSQFFAARRCAGASQSSLIRYAGGGTAHIPSLDAVLSSFPRNAFDYVWVVGASTPIASAHPDLKPVRKTSRSTLFSIQPRRR